MCFGKSMSDSLEKKWQNGTYFPSQFSTSKSFRVQFFDKKTFTALCFNLSKSLFSKIMPIFWWTDIHCIQNIQWFPLSKYVGFWPNIMLFQDQYCLYRTHHLWNSTTAMTIFTHNWKQNTRFIQIVWSAQYISDQFLFHDLIHLYLLLKIVKALFS